MIAKYTVIRNIVHYVRKKEMLATNIAVNEKKLKSSDRLIHTSKRAKKET